MRGLFFLSAIAATCSLSAARLPARNYQTHDYYAVHLDPSTDPAEFASHVGLTHEGPLGAIDDHHLFKADKKEHDVIETAIEELRRKRRKRTDGYESSPLDSVKFNQKQKLKPRMWKRGVIPPLSERTPQGSPVDAAVLKQREIMTALQINDPTFKDQWHLYNTKFPGNDLNVTGVWMQGITGKDTNVCIVDDGLDMDSDDLKDNFFAKGSYDFNDHVDLPKPRLSDDRHGTRCAGEVAAGRNNACGLGLAYDGKVSGVRILSAEISDADEALAINYELEENHIYSCSWGPPDDGQTMQGPDVLIRKAMVTAVQKGRGGKGSIYVFAAGNGAASDDNCNFDGYTNSIYSVTVGAVQNDNAHPYYSEACSAQLVVAYSSGGVDGGIRSTDVGTNKCTSSHGGTSAAGPLAAGVYALVLSVRPDLTWRDVQWIQVMSAMPFDSAPNDWQTTPLGRKFSHQYGYGKLDAWQTVEVAKSWKLVKPQAWYWAPWMHVKKDIPEGDQGLASTFTVTEEALKKANLERLEHITLTMNVKHTRRGDLSVELHSPSGIVSYLSTPRKNDNAHIGYVDWTFMSVAHWGESGVGDWTIIVKDTKTNEHQGTFEDWKLRLWGEAIDASSQTLLPLPDGHEDDDEVVTVPAHTTSVAVPSSTSEATVNPTGTDHPDRPVNQKPGGDATSTNALSTPTSAVPDQTPATTADPTASATVSAAPDSFLPSPFPTFGVSKKTQIWIYGALSLILIFCISLAVYLFMARRKRLRNNPRDAYEFEVLDDQDDGAGAGLTGAGRKGKNRRAGELYDAFAGESDEDLFSDDDEAEGLEAYRDEKRGQDEDEEQFNEKSRLRRASGSDDERR